MRHRRCRRSKLLLVTAVARGRESGIHVVRVARDARRDGRMRTRQREQCIVVVERRRLPRGVRMARRAICRKPGVRRRGGGREILLVAPVARRCEADILVVHVALRARHRYVRAHERKRRRLVVERGGTPTGIRRMAPRAVSRESGVCHRGRGRGELLLMAVIARCREPREHVVHVALLARDAHVSPGQRERRVGVVERRRLPRRHRVAGCAVCRESRVGWSRRICKIRRVARSARRRDREEPVPRMALHAGGCGVRPEEGEPRLRVVERAAEAHAAYTPVHCVHRVAALAVGPQPRLAVVRCLRRVIVSLVAPEAVRPETREFVFLLVRVAFLARHRRMNSHEREPGRGVPLDHVRHEPRLGRVAPVARRAELAVVHVLMTVRAARRRFCELERQARVAVHALHLVVLSFQHESGLLVVEFRRHGHLLP